jgi:protein SCO1/2
MTKYYAGAAVLAVIAGIGIGTYVVSGFDGGDRFDPCRSSVVAGGAGRIGGSFTLVSETGETVTDADVITAPTLLYFGYTFCPDVCPLDTVRNADAVEILAERGHAVTPVFVSVDPRRDTPEVVDDFTANIHENMLGLTGSPDQIDAAAQAYKVYFRAHESEDDYYLVDHSTFSYLVLPGEGFVEFFRRELPAEDMADQIACFLNAA